MNSKLNLTAKKKKEEKKENIILNKLNKIRDESSDTYHRTKLSRTAFP